MEFLINKLLSKLSYENEYCYFDDNINHFIYLVNKIKQFVYSYNNHYFIVINQHFTIDDYITSLQLKHKLTIDFEDYVGYNDLNLYINFIDNFIKSFEIYNYKLLTTV